MAKQGSASWTTRLGGNRTIVLVVMVGMLVLFTVASDVLPALGLASKDEEYVRFHVGGRTVAISQGRFRAQMDDWQRYQQGLLVTKRIQRGSTAEFLEDLMLAELARDAGLSIPDASVREYVRNHPLFQDTRGEFSARQFDEGLARYFGRISPRAFEEQVRLQLLTEHYRKVYAASFLQVSDEEIHRRWKADHPKIAIAYAWAPVAPVRETMGPSDLEEGAVEEYWKNSLVQRRHMLPPRYTFTAAWVRTVGVDDAAYAQARAEAKDDKDLQVGEEEAYEYWFKRREYAFNVGEQAEPVLKALRSENEARVREEDAKAKEAAPPVPQEGGAAPEPDLYDAPPDSISDREQYRRYWRHRIEKEIWLRKRMERLLAEARDKEAKLIDLAAQASRPGLEVKVHVQEEPIDQYAVEKIEGLGGPNCPLRYSLNQKGKADEGKVHPEVIEATADAGVLPARGWVVYRVQGVVPERVPELDDVRDAVTGQLLDQRARDRVGADLEAFRKQAEDARKGLAEAAKEKGLPSDVTEPFHDSSWRPPFPRPKPGETTAPAADRWQDAGRRLGFVMSRYGTLREIPPESWSNVLDDVEGTGAFYIAQVLRREEPVFEEMTLAQKNQVRRLLGRERLGDLAREISYGAMKERLQLTLDGKPAPAFDRQ